MEKVPFYLLDSIQFSLHKSPLLTFSLNVYKKKRKVISKSQLETQVDPINLISGMKL